jgi:hypothetical protein
MANNNVMGISLSPVSYEWICLVVYSPKTLPNAS